MTAVELFAGAGGMALGVMHAGFSHLAVIECDPLACETIRANQTIEHSLAKDWPLYEADVRTFCYAPLRRQGGFTMCRRALSAIFAWWQREGHSKDERDMFSEIVRATRELRPKALLIENVRGLEQVKIQALF